MSNERDMVAKMTEATEAKSGGQLLSALNEINNTRQSGATHYNEARIANDPRIREHLPEMSLLLGQELAERNGRGETPEEAMRHFRPANLLEENIKNAALSQYEGAKSEIHAGHGPFHKVGSMVHHQMDHFLHHREQATNDEDHGRRGVPERLTELTDKFRHPFRHDSEPENNPRQAQAERNIAETPRRSTEEPNRSADTPARQTEAQPLQTETQPRQTETQPRQTETVTKSELDRQKEEQEYREDCAHIGHTMADRLNSNTNSDENIAALTKALENWHTSTVPGAEKSIADAFNQTMKQHGGKLELVPHVHSDTDSDATPGYDLVRHDHKSAEQRQQTRNETIQETPAAVSAPENIKTAEVQRDKTDSHPNQYQDADALVKDIVANHQRANAMMDQTGGSFVEGSRASQTYEKATDDQLTDRLGLEKVIQAASKKSPEAEKALIEHINKEMSKAGYHITENNDEGSRNYVLKNDKTGDEVQIGRTGKTLNDSDTKEAAHDKELQREQENSKRAREEEDNRPKPQDASQMAAEIAKDGGKLPENHVRDLETLIEKQISQHKDLGAFAKQVNDALTAQGSSYKIDLDVTRKNGEYESNPSMRYHKIALKISNAGKPVSNDALQIIAPPID